MLKVASERWVNWVTLESTMQEPDFYRMLASMVIFVVLVAAVFFGLAYGVILARNIMALV